MNCRKVSHLISAYADGELPGVEHRSVHEHLRHCGSCRNEYEGVLETKRLLGAMPLPSSRSEFVQTIMARIEAEQMTSPKRGGFWQMVEEKLRTNPALPQGAAVATGVALLGVLLFGQRLNTSSFTFQASGDEALETAPATMVVPLQGTVRFSPVQALLFPKLASRFSGPHPPAVKWETSARNYTPSFALPVNYLSSGH